MTWVITIRTYRRLAIVAVALLALLPCVYLSCQAVYFQGARLVAEHVEMCSRHLGMSVAIGRVAVRSPRSLMYHDFAIIDPETNLHLVWCERLEVDTRDNRLTLTGLGTSFHSPGTEGAFDRLQRIMQQAQRGAWDEVLIRCPEPGRFQSGGDTVPFVRLDATCRLNDDPQTAVLEIALPDRPSGPPLTATVTVRPSKTGRQATVTFDTGPVPVPHEVAKVFLSIQTWLGTACRTQGAGTLVRTAYSHRVDFAGRLKGIDLGTLSSGRLPVGLIGRVDLRVDQLHWSDGRLTSFEGELTGGPGGVHVSLARLLPRPPFGFLWLEPLPDAPIVPFEKVGARLRVDGSAVTVRGTLPASGAAVGQKNGVVLVGRDGPLLLDPLKPIPLDALRFWFDRELADSVKRRPGPDRAPWWEVMLPTDVAEDFLGVDVPATWPTAVPLDLLDYSADLLLPESLRDLLFP